MKKIATLHTTWWYSAARIQLKAQGEVFFTSRKRVDQNQLCTIPHNTYASYAHNGAVDQSTVQIKYMIN